MVVRHHNKTNKVCIPMHVQSLDSTLMSILQSSW